MTLVYCQVQTASLGRTEGTLYMFLQISSWTKVGQFGFGNGYSNGTLFLFSHLEFPAEWLAEWRKWSCQGTVEKWGTWYQFWPGLGVWPQVGCQPLCARSPATCIQRYDTLCMYRKDDLFGELFSPHQKWSLEWVEQANRWWTKHRKHVRTLDCKGACVTLWGSLPSLGLTLFICEQRGLDKYSDSSPHPDMLVSKFAGQYVFDVA